jgi:hypothetical protein
LSPVDKGGPFQRGEFSAPRSEFEATLRRHRIPMSRVSITEGFFDETLKPENRELSALDIDRATVAFIDCDLYESTVPVLDFLSAVLVDGAVLIFDDWFNFRARPDRGQQRATHEWLESNPSIRLVQYRDFHWAGRSFIVNRSDER